MFTITTIPVTYRDASNYKYSGSIELLGVISAQDKETIKSFLEDENDFIPTNVYFEHVGAKELKEKFGSEDDHVFNTLHVDAAETSQVESVDPDIVTVSRFMVALQSEHESGWQVSAAMEELGL